MCFAFDMPLVFAQSSDESFPARIAERHGATHFGLAIAAEAVEANVTTFNVSSSGVRAAYRVSVRPITEDDLARARAAASRGGAPGMAELAARCRTAWLVEALNDPPAWLTWECCALVAFVALGPILPDDGASLLGVRSARERADRLRAASG
jgi:hypothetical protein